MLFRLTLIITLTNYLTLMDINNIGPSNANTLDSVSDWLISIFTITSIILLWRTLFSQKKVHQLQQTSSKIDALRYLKEIKPVSNVKPIMDLLIADFGFCTSI